MAPDRVSISAAYDALEAASATARTGSTTFTARRIPRRTRRPGAGGDRCRPVNPAVGDFTGVPAAFDYVLDPRSIRSWCMRRPLSSGGFDQRRREPSQLVDA